MRKIIILFVLLSTLNSFSQQYRSPLDIPLQLSANCGELRNNHFHSGIDIKTQSVTGKAIYSIEDGYVSRINVSPSGYGLALYIDHPQTGHTSVYGHLESYNREIGSYIKQKQYEQESFSIDLQLKPNQIPVKKGDIVAYSGNTGGSGGPHLHFEIRETKTQSILDPLLYFKDMITDTRPPMIKGIAAYPVPGRGMINGSTHPLRQSIFLLKNGNYSEPKQVIEAWGIIGLGIKAYDKMDGNANIYGVKTAEMHIDGKQIFRYNIESFRFDQTRMINTFTDFADWRLHKSFFMLSFIEPGNTLPFYTAHNNGYINIKEERPYTVLYKLEDIYGNKSLYQFQIIGKKQDIVIPSGCSLVMDWSKDNRYINDNFSLIIPKGNLYNDICFTLSETDSKTFYSNIFTVNKIPIPIHKSAELKIRIKNDTLINKQQYGIVQVNNNNKYSWIGGNYKDGTVTASIRELGLRLAISCDTEPPTISPILNNKTIKNGRKKIVQQVKSNEIKLKVTDNLSGIKSFRGTIDGKFALFTHDIKSPIYTYKFDDSRIGKGKKHKLVFSATDACGNTSEYITEFEY